MITANEYNGCTLEQYERLPKRGLFAKFKRLHLPLPIGMSEDGEPLKAYVNHGRWVVKCECGGAEKAWEELKFMCQSCCNAGHRHRYRLAIFPRNRKAIEALLAKRPLPNRNWTPGETLAQLRRENEEHKGELL